MPSPPSKPVNFGLTLNQRLATSVSRFAQQATMISQNMRVSVPAVVRKFSPGPPATVEVTIAIYEKVQWNVNGPSGPINLQVQNMTPGSKQLGEAVIQDVPVLIPGGGGWSLTFPIKEGDECLLVFSDLEIDSWLANGGTENYTLSSRRHDLSDAIAIFGLRSKPRSVVDYSTTSTQLRNDARTVIIDLSDTKITVSAQTVDVIANNVNILAADTVATKANTVTINAASTVAINTVAGTTTIEGKNFLLHTHIGVQTGGGKSGPVF